MRRTHKLGLFGFVGLTLMVSQIVARPYSAHAFNGDPLDGLVFLRQQATGGEVSIPNSFGFTVVDTTFVKKTKSSRVKIHWDGNIRTDDNSTSGCDVLIYVDSVLQQNRFFSFEGQPNGNVSVIADIYVDGLSRGTHTVKVELNPGGHPTTLSPLSEQRKPWLLEVFEIL
jgi:hypothetical protein